MTLCDIVTLIVTPLISGYIQLYELWEKVLQQKITICD